MNIQKIQNTNSFKAAALITGSKNDLAKINSVLRRESNTKTDFHWPFDYEHLILNTNSAGNKQSAIFLTGYQTEGLADFEHDLNNIPRVGKFPIRIKKFFDKYAHKYFRKIQKYDAQKVLEAIEDYKFDFRNLLITDRFLV